MSCPRCDGRPILNAGAWIAPAGEQPRYGMCQGCGQRFCEGCGTATEDGELCPRCRENRP